MKGREQIGAFLNGSALASHAQDPGPTQKYNNSKGIKDKAMVKNRRHRSGTW